MTLYIKVIFWNVTKLKVWLYTDVDFIVIASVLEGLYQLTCVNIYCYVELFRPMCGHIKKFRTVESSHARLAI